ncbi:MAG: putative peptide-modifying radical SAM/SPASM domain-containing protein, partial [Thermoplasmata archaeon]|nr:putative peptide-modifying radical SAM/SPASM domain-containing protein [Thermoplasmata archaeon]
EGPRIGEPCTSCPYFRYCGGRCLFAYFERYWGERGFKLLCELTKHLIDEVKSRLPRILELLELGIVQSEAIIYPKFNNTTEIIP